ncbi:MAG TPA: glycosyltransferase family 2 protein [Acidobacteriota bacterium]
MTEAPAKTQFPGVSIIIPAYNEEKSLAGVIEEIQKVCHNENIDFEIIVVDDGSTDNTIQSVEGKSVHVVRHPENRGYGASIKTGVLSSKFPWILITDADGTYPVSEIPKLLEDVDHYDMIVGSRTGEDVNIPAVRKPAKWMLNQLANFMVSSHIPDLNSGFRLFRKNSFLRFLNIYPTGFSLTTTMTLALLSNNHAVKYVPINYYKRQGNSKIRPIHDTYNFFLLVVRTIMYFDPLRIFMPIALFLFLFGIVFTAWEIYLWRNITTAATIVLFAALQTAILGLLADLIVKGRR